jgi:hypothetical protein
MAFIGSELPDYDAQLYECLHQTMDHLIDLGARCNAHRDVLDADDDDSRSDDDGPHPVKVLKAQLNLDGAEDEVQETQALIQILSQILITRHTRRVLNLSGNNPAPHRSGNDHGVASLIVTLQRPPAGPSSEDGGDVHHDGASISQNSDD